MKKRFTFGICLIMCISLLAGCKKSTNMKLSSVNEDTICVGTDGTIELADVEDFDKEYYKESELKSFVKDAVATYEEKNEKGAVSLEDFSVKNGVAKVLLSFKTAEDYAKFQGVDFRMIDASQINGNLVLPESFVSVETGKKEAKADVLSKEGVKILIVNEPITIKVEGAIKYYSDASMIGDNEIQATSEDTAVVVYE